MKYGTTIGPLYNPIEEAKLKNKKPYQILTSYIAEQAEHFAWTEQPDFMASLPIFKFHPDNCRGTRDNADRRYIGAAPASSPIV